MATCPSGHQSNQTDFCDTCGLPVSAQPPVASAPIEVGTPSLACPNCATGNVADALFCEACGYDFTTGTAAPAVPQWPHLDQPAGATPSPAQPAPVSADLPPSQTAPSPESAAEVAALPPQPDPSAQLDPSISQLSEPPQSGDSGASVDQEPAADPAPPVPGSVLPPRPVVNWVAELWIDPDWYAAQGSTDPMPSAGLPDIVPLVKQTSLIGRVSHSRGIFPEIDCELDTGCSRRHAMLTTDGTRWWIEDLDSANGTFVGGAAGPLPGMPIPQGRVELAAGQRVYVGAWTRIVIRKATPDEREAFAG